MKHLIKFKDGHVGIMNTVEDDINPSDEILKWHENDRGTVDSHCPLSEDDIPKDWYFRDAWFHNGNQINIDVEKCKDIHRNKLRELRKPKLESLDIEFMKASETGDDERKKEVVALKQFLRDVTQHPDLVNAKTPEEIKSFMPDILKET